MTCCADSRCGVAPVFWFEDMGRSPCGPSSCSCWLRSARWGRMRPRPRRFSITGVVKSGNTPIPGATVTATNPSTRRKTTTSTDINGAYTLQVAATGKYQLRVEMPAFAPSTREIVVARGRAARADLELTLLSRTQQAERTQQRPATARAGRGFQSLSVMQGLAASETSNSNGADQIVPVRNAGAGSGRGHCHRIGFILRKQLRRGHVRHEHGRTGPEDAGRARTGRRLRRRTGRRWTGRRRSRRRSSGRRRPGRRFRRLRRLRRRRRAGRPHDAGRRPRQI